MILKQVIFLNTYPPFNAGEIAGFSKDRADELVKGKRALYYTEPTVVKVSNVVGEALPKVKK